MFVYKYIDIYKYMPVYIYIYILLWAVTRAGTCYLSSKSRALFQNASPHETFLEPSGCQPC